MRVFVALVVLSFGITELSAQILGPTDPNFPSGNETYTPPPVETRSAVQIQTELNRCLIQVSELETRAINARNEYELLDNSYRILVAARNGEYLPPSSPLRQALDNIFYRWSDASTEAYVSESTLNYIKKKCDDLAAELKSLPRPTDGKLSQLIREIRAADKRARRQIGQFEQSVAVLKRQIPAARANLERHGLTVGAPYRIPFDVRFSLVGDFGRPLTEVERRFPDFGQTLGETANGGWYGGLGAQADIPFTFDGPFARVWFSVAATMFYLNMKLDDVRNDGGGTGFSRGDDILRGAALLFGLGGRPFPDHPVFGRWEWQFLGGPGYALNSIRGANSAGVEQFSGSQWVTPWLGRFALYYSITDNLKAGLALSLITTPAIMGRLPSGTQFQIGRVTNYVAAISMVYSFYTASQGR